MHSKTEQSDRWCERVPGKEKARKIRCLFEKDREIKIKEKEIDIVDRIAFSKEERSLKEKKGEKDK